VASDPDTLLLAEETDWITAAKAGDRQAFARLVERYWDRLYRWLCQMTRDPHRAEDLTQETFLKALVGLDTFRPGTNFRAWLFRIAHNNFVNLKRGERKGVQSLPDAVADDDTPAADAAADREALRMVAAAVAELPPDYRAAILLRADGGLSFKEIATALHTTEETARWRVFKARQKLVKVLHPDLLPAEELVSPKRERGSGDAP
jgi:RNA polymerase sigma-70 factor (ECF subfamily)